MQDRYFSDEELVAYLDGEADFAPVAAIDQALGQDHALQKRLAALQIDPDAIEAAFADLGPSTQVVPLAAPVAVNATTPPRNVAWLFGSIAASVAALVVGISIGSARVPALDGWDEYVAAYQALYATSTLAHVTATDSQKQAELDRVTASIGKSIALENLDMFPEAEFTRSQILSFQGQALIQLAFLTSTGDPLALCIIRNDGVPDSAPALAQMEGLSTARWAQNGYDFILIGGNDDALIRRMSSTFDAISI